MADPASPDSGRAYHHGDLRAALVSAALRILETEGMDAMSLRAVARAAGVSQTAPYRHFPDRRALVAAVAAQGFRGLREAMELAMSPGQAQATGFRGVAHAYVRFGRANPALYRVMFGPEVANTEDLPELRASARASLGFVQAGLERLQAMGLVRAGDASLLAVATWATLHGLTSLILDGQAATVAPDDDTVIEATAQLVLLGLSPRAPA